MPLYNSSKGFTLIELIIVVAIIGILAAIAIPGYIGMQERERKGAAIKYAEAATSELKGWITAARKGSALHPQKLLTEVDTDGSGAVVVGTDENNQTLASGGVVAQFITATGIGGLNQVSPWNANLPLWKAGAAAASQAICNAAATNGQIMICFNPAQDATIENLFISAKDNDGNVIFSKGVYAD